MKPRHWVVIALLLAGVAAWCGLCYLARSVDTESFSLLEDNLYVGGLVESPPPGTHAVVNLCEHKDRFDAGIHHWEPIDGSQAPSIAQLQRIISYIDTHRRDGKTVYVHCLAGMNRSGMVVTAYLMHEHGWTRDEALVFAQSKRPLIQPNPTLMRFLADWETALKQR